MCTSNLTNSNLIATALQYNCNIKSNIDLLEQAIHSASRRQRVKQNFMNEFVVHSKWALLIGGLPSRRSLAAVIVPWYHTSVLCNVPYTTDYGDTWCNQKLCWNNNLNDFVYIILRILPDKRKELLNLLLLAEAIHARSNLASKRPHKACDSHDKIHYIWSTLYSVVYIATKFIITQSSQFKCNSLHVLYYHSTKKMAGTSSTSGKSFILHKPGPW